MMNAVIIENEKLAIKDLVSALATVAGDIQIAACLRSVRESVAYLSQQPPVDLIFSGVQLSDGLSFEIFNQAGIHTPVIFITGYDEFIKEAFQCNGIDYIPKPLQLERLSKAIGKYRTYSKHFSESHPFQLNSRLAGARKRKRLLVKLRSQMISLPLQEIVLFYLEVRSVYVLDRLGAVYEAGMKLHELEWELDEEQFFRVNRQYIVNLDYIRGYSSFAKVKIKVELTLPQISHQIIVSQEMAPRFRAWMGKG